jgi:hypothetical protein
VPVIDFVVHNQTESQLFYIELQTALVVANENCDVLNAKVGILPIQPWARGMRPETRRNARHPRNYKLRESSGNGGREAKLERVNWVPDFAEYPGREA